MSALLRCAGLPLVIRGAHNTTFHAFFMCSLLSPLHTHTRTGASRREPPSRSVNEAELHKKKKLSARPNVVECKMSVVNSQCSSSLRSTLPTPPPTPFFKNAKGRAGMDGGKEEGPWHKRRPIVGAGAGGQQPCQSGFMSGLPSVPRHSPCHCKRAESRQNRGQPRFLSC